MTTLRRFFRRVAHYRWTLPVLIALVAVVWFRAAAPWEPSVAFLQQGEQGTGASSAELRGFWEADLYDRFVPALAFLGDGLRRGGVPLWNPFQLSGLPFLATHEPAALYPPMWLAALVGGSAGVNFFLGMHALSGALGAWFALRLLSGRGDAAAAGAVAFILSGAFSLAAYHPFTFAVVSWLPWQTLALVALVRRSTPAKIIGVAVVFAFAFLAGRAQIFLYASCASVALAILEAAHTGRLRRPAGLILSTGTSLLLFLGLVAPQLLPTLDLARESAWGLEGLGSAADPGLSELVAVWRLPSWFADPRLGAAGLTLFVLPCALVAAVLGFSRVHVCGCLALMFVMWDFGQGGPGVFGRVHSALGWGSMFRGSYRIDFAVVWVGSILVAEGVAASLSKIRPPYAAAFALALVAGVVGDLITRNWLPLDFPSLTAPESFVAREVPELRRLPHEAGAGRTFVVRKLLQHDFGAREGMRSRFLHASDYEPLLPAAYARLFGVSSGTGWLGAIAPDLGMGPLYRPGPERPVVPVELLDLLSVDSYVDVRYPVVRRIATRPEAQPRVRIVHDTRFVADQDAAFESIRADPRQAGLFPVVEGLSERLGENREGEFARLTVDEPDRVVMEVECHTDCLVVLTDLFADGWSARAGDSPVPILRVNALFRGVRLPAGKVTLEYRYRPAGFVRGLQVFVATLMVIAAMMAFRRWGLPFRR